MQNIHHGKPSKNFTTIWANRTEIFIPCKQVENNHVIDNSSQPGLKMIDYGRVFTLVSAEQC